METAAAGRRPMNLSTLFEASLVRRSAAPALEFGAETWTFGELESGANRLARALLELGVRRGDRVAVYLKNRPELILIYLAASKAGFVFTPINILYRAGEIAHILDDAAPAALFLDKESDAYVAPLLDLRPAVRKLFADDLAAWSAGQSGEPLEGPAPEASDLMALVYTSGTTGRPKGASLTQSNFSANARSLVEAWRITADDRLLLSLPLFHIHGLGNGLHTWLATGYRLRLLERFRKETIVGDFLDFRPTVFFGVPTMYERLLETPPAEAREIGGFMRLFVSGSAPLPAATLERFEALFGHRILERYGMSETMMNTSNPYDGERRAGSVGPPLPGVSIRVCCAETGREVLEGVVGEVQIQGPNVFSGYWRQAAATEEAFTEDGFFRSGDLGFLSKDGYLTLEGRGKELIISSGFNVYPREVEEFLATLPGVREAAVVGIPDPVKGEVPAAYVALEEGADLGAVQAACPEKLASFKIPKRFTRVDALPRNALGKVQKHLLRTDS
ncbi:MAG: AMP-binding protein [Acidobacteria bacterium]|nr:AMP-binding protein [Acidobacteriota bacterium]